MSKRNVRARTKKAKRQVQVADATAEKAAEAAVAELVAAIEDATEVGATKEGVEAAFEAAIGTVGAEDEYLEILHTVATVATIKRQLGVRNVTFILPGDQDEKDPTILKFSGRE
jgi:hypothetical protein